MSERRKEAYSASSTNKIRFYETCGHNKLCPYKGCILLSNSCDFKHKQHIKKAALADF